MPNTKDAPQKSIQVGGVVLSAPSPYAEGHALTKNEAAVLNQTYHENIGNNYRGKVEAALRRTIVSRNIPEGTEPSAAQLSAVSKQDLTDFRKSLAEEGGQAQVDTAALQAGMDELVAAYEFGVRRTSSVEVIDPVTKEARAIAKKSLSEALKARGTKLNTVSADWYAREVENVLDKEGDNPAFAAQVWKIAARRVKAAAEVAAMALDKVNLSGMAKDEAPEESPQA